MLFWTIQSNLKGRKHEKLDSIKLFFMIAFIALMNVTMPLPIVAEYVDSPACSPAPLSALQRLAQRAVFAALYPIQNTVVKVLFPSFKPTNLDKARITVAEKLTNQGFAVQHVRLERHGIAYSALIVTRPENNADKWVLQATGILDPIEHHLETFAYAEQYASRGYNLLMINGPGVGRSEGTCTPQTMGDAQGVGISFLETIKKAKRLVIAGFSLGGAMTSQAILQHTFQTAERNYLVIRQMSFDKLSHVASRFLHRDETSWIGRFIRWSGAEIDSIKASQKLSELQIPEVVIESEQGDKVIAKEACLGYNLEKLQLLDASKRLIHVEADHTPQLDKTVAAIAAWEESLNAVSHEI